MAAADEGGNENLWTPKELGAYLSVSRSWIYAKTQTGLIPFMNVGGLLRFSPAKIRAWAESQTANPARCDE